MDFSAVRPGSVSVPPPAVAAEPRGAAAGGAGGSPTPPGGATGSGPWFVDEADVGCCKGWGGIRACLAVLLAVLLAVALCLLIAISDWQDMKETSKWFSYDEEKEVNALCSMEGDTCAASADSYNAATGKCYHVLDEKMTRHKAQVACYRRTMSLATIENKAENEFVFDTYGKKSPMWIGYSYDSDTEKLTSVSEGAVPAWPRADDIMHEKSKGSPERKAVVFGMTADAEDVLASLWVAFIVTVVVAGAGLAWFLLGFVWYCCCSQGRQDPATSRKGPVQAATAVDSVFCLLLAVVVGLLVWAIVSDASAFLIASLVMAVVALVVLAVVIGFDWYLLRSVRNTEREAEAARRKSAMCPPPHPGRYSAESVPANAVAPPVAPPTTGLRQSAVSYTDDMKPDLEDPPYLPETPSPRRTSQGTPPFAPPPLMEVPQEPPTTAKIMGLQYFRAPAAACPRPQSSRGSDQQSSRDSTVSAALAEPKAFSSRGSNMQSSRVRRGSAALAEPKPFSSRGSNMQSSRVNNRSAAPVVPQLFSSRGSNMQSSRVSNLPAAPVVPQPFSSRGSNTSGGTNKSDASESWLQPIRGSWEPSGRASVLSAKE